MKLILAIALLFASVPAWTAEIYSFGLLPSSGSIAGLPGQTIGWGYALANQSTSQWLVTTGAAPGAFQNGTPNLVFDFPILAPSSSVTMPFNSAALTGLLALTWDATAPLGAVESGSFLLNAEWWNGNPLAGGRFAGLASPTSQSYSARVGAAVPEPATSVLIALPLLAAGVMRRLRRRQSGGTLD